MLPDSSHAFAVRYGSFRPEGIPVVLTAMADEFGGPPLADTRESGLRYRGLVIASYLKRSRRPCHLNSTESYGRRTAGRLSDGGYGRGCCLHGFLCPPARQTEELPEEEVRIAHWRYTHDYGSAKTKFVEATGGRCESRRLSRFARARVLLIGIRSSTCTRTGVP